MAIPWLQKTLLLCIICGIPPQKVSIASAECLPADPKPFLLPLANCTIPPNQYYPNGIDSWGLQLNIASQYLCAVPSLVANNTVIMGSSLCTNDNSSTLDQCISRRGGVFHFDDATLPHTNLSTGVLAPDPVWESFNPPFSTAVNTTMVLPSGINLPSYPLAISSVGQNSNANQLGLANQSVLLHSLMSAGFSGSNAFGLLAGSQSVQRPRNGHLVIGGYDAAMIAGPFRNFSMSNTTLAGNRVCSLQVVVEQLTLRRKGQPDIDLLSEGNLMPSCVEP